LRQTLEEEKKTDLLLNKLACDEINACAASNGDDDERAGRTAA
jgi:ferritin-like metal-binding protein YciE